MTDDGCGTQSGYARHIRLGEPIDDACRIAHTRVHRKLGGVLGTASVAPTELDDVQRRAALVIVDHATDPADARELLAAVGLLTAGSSGPADA